MAKRKTTTTTVIQSNDAGEVAVGDQPVNELDAFSELTDLGADDGVTYTVTKIATKPGEPAGYCGRFTRDDLSPETIRAQWGGGKYKIVAKDARGQYVGGRHVDIVGGPPAAAPGVAGPQSNLAELAALLKHDDGNSNAALLKMLDNQQSMINALLTKPAPAPPPGPTFTEILTLIKEMVPKKTDDLSAVDLLLKGVNLGKDLGGGETGWLDIGRDALGLVKPLIESKTAETAQPGVATAPVARRIPTASTNGAQPAPGTVPARDPMLQKLAWLTAQTRALVLQASRGKDPELYAEVMLDNLPDYITREEIKERMSGADAVAQLAKVNSDVAKYVEWFEAFRVEVLELIAEDEEPDATTTDDEEREAHGDEAELP